MNASTSSFSGSPQTSLDNFLRLYYFQPTKFCYGCQKLKLEDRHVTWLNFRGEKIPRDQTVEKLQLCGRCSVARYCSPNCQKTDWKRHKVECFDRAETALNEKVIEEIIQKEFAEKVAPRLDQKLGAA